MQEKEKRKNINFVEIFIFKFVQLILPKMQFNLYSLAYHLNAAIINVVFQLSAAHLAEFIFSAFMLM